jgi:hypothetical protein
MGTEVRDADISKLLESASPEVREIVRRVIELERQKVHMKKPLGIVQDITKMVKEVIRHDIGSGQD